jgi:hypothetical protein
MQVQLQQIQLQVQQIQLQLRLLIIDTNCINILTVCTVSVRFVIVVKQVQVNISKKCQVLTDYIKIIYVLCRWRASSLLFQYIVSILWILTVIFMWIGEVLYILYKRKLFNDWLFLRVIRRRWRYTSVSTQYSLTYRTGKQFDRKQEKLKCESLYKKWRDFSLNSDGCYAINILDYTV